MNLIITISILCFVSLAACIPATGYESAKDEASETEVKRKASQLLAVNRQADERLPEHFADTQKILNALKISRDTRGSPKCNDEYEPCYSGSCCPPLSCEYKRSTADVWIMVRSGSWCVDTRILGQPNCKGEYEYCSTSRQDCCPPSRCEDQAPEAYAWCVDRSGLWYSSIMQRKRCHQDTALTAAPESQIAI